MIRGNLVLKSARVSAGLSQYELGRMVGVSGNYISQIELGRVRPSEELTYRLTVVLDVPADKFGRIEQ